MVIPFLTGLILGLIMGYCIRVLHKPKWKGPLPNALCEVMHDEATRVSASSALPFDIIFNHLKNCMVHKLYCPLKEKK